MKAKLYIATIILSLGSSFTSVAQLTAYANIYATVVAPVGISDLSNETLGTIVIASNQNSTSLKSTSFVTVSGMQVAQNGTATVASFSLTDYNNTTFDLTLPTSTIKMSDGKDSLLASNFSSSYSMANSLQGGKTIIRIGANMHLPEDQTTSNFFAQNRFPVTLNYN